MKSYTTLLTHKNVRFSLCLLLNSYRGKSPRIVLAVIGGAINSSSIINSVSSSPVSDDDDFDYIHQMYLNVEMVNPYDAIPEIFHKRMNAIFA